MKKTILSRTALGLLTAAVCAPVSIAQSLSTPGGMRGTNPRPTITFFGPPVEDVFGFVGDTTLGGGWDDFDLLTETPLMEVLDSGLQGNPPSTITSISSPSGGTLTFCPPMERRDIGPDWVTWSHGYAGEIFRDTGVATVTIELPQGSTAFDAYVQPFPFTCDTYVIECTAEGNLVVTVAVGASGFSGANHFGFYATGGLILEQVEITALGFGSGYAIGEVRTGPPAVGTSYCVATAHSGGAPALISATGGPSLGDPLNLRTEPVPAQPGIFIYSINQQQNPFCDGNLCVGPGQIVRLNPPVTDNSDLVATRTIIPSGVGVVGQTNYQYWFRDPAAGGTGCNLSDAITVP